MVNNCNLIKYVYSNVVTLAPYFLARNVYFAGLDVELLERAELLLWERDYDKTGDTQIMDFVIERT